MALTRALSELSTLFSLLAHPLRLRFVEELAVAERSVGDLAETTHVAQAIASQQLILLKAQRVITQRRDGRHVFYRLNRPQLAEWVAQGLNFIDVDTDDVSHVSRSIRQARKEWTKRIKPRRPQ